MAERVLEGFKFEDGTSAYHCFNCGIKSTYNTNYSTVPKDMEKILTSFGIPEDEIGKHRLASLQG